MSFLFFAFIGVMIAVLIVSGYRRAGRNRLHHPPDVGGSWMFLGSSGSTHHSHHPTHDHGHSHHSGCGHAGHVSGGSGDCGGGGDGGGSD